VHFSQQSESFFAVRYKLSLSLILSFSSLKELCLLTCKFFHIINVYTHTHTHTHTHTRARAYTHKIIIYGAKFAKCTRLNNFFFNLLVSPLNCDPSRLLLILLKGNGSSTMGCRNARAQIFDILPHAPIFNYF